MTGQKCATCRWCKSLLPKSENDYYVCTFHPISRPLFDLVMFSQVRNPGFKLSVGDPNSDYGSLCAVYAPEEP